MSLHINTDHVVGVYALGQWHPVKKGSLYFDAYEVAEHFDANADRVDHYEMGLLYPKVEFKHPGGLPGSIGEHWRFLAPSGMTGVQWIDPENEWVVSMSIQEIKAWREDK